MLTNNLAVRSNLAIMQLDNKMNRCRFLTGNALKMIAVLAMLLDHFCKIVLQWLLNNYWFELYNTGKMTWEQYSRIDNFIRFDLYAVGAMAFPVFCYLLSEGFHYTKNRRRYIGLMLVFAIVSELPFDLGFFANLSKRTGTFPFYWGYQNVFFTLCLGLIALECVERFSCNSKKKTDKIKSLSLQVASVAIIAIASELIKCDYGKNGILFIVAFYICRQNRVYQILLFLVTYMLVTGEQPTVYIILSCLMILFYNGARGKLKLKYFFYVFYPLHISLLYIVTLFLPRLIGLR